MTEKNIDQDVIDCIREALATGDKPIGLNTRIMADLGADSLDFLDILFRLEEKLGLRLEKDDFNFLKKIELNETDAIKDGFLTPLAVEKLQKWLAALPAGQQIKPAQLKDFITIASIVNLIKYS